MKNLKTLVLLISLGITPLFASPGFANGCKFHGTTALSCSDGAGGYVNSFFNGEKWTEPVHVQATPLSYPQPIPVDVIYIKKDCSYGQCGRNYRSNDRYGHNRHQNVRRGYW